MTGRPIPLPLLPSPMTVTMPWPAAVTPCSTSWRPSRRSRNSSGVCSSSASPSISSPPPTLAPTSTTSSLPTALANPPIGQKVFWCWTEGAVAIALLRGGYESGQNALGAVQAVSIVAGLPFTVSICFMCTSIWRALKIDSGDADICHANLFSTGTLDIFDLYKTGPADEPSTARYTFAERLTNYAQSIFAPFVGIFKTCESLFGEGSVLAKLHGFVNFSFFVLWLVFLIVSGSDADYAWIGWTFYVFMALQISFIRGYRQDPAQHLRQHV